MRVETLVEGLATAGRRRDAQVEVLFKTVRALERTVASDQTVRATESARDRRTMKLMVGGLSALWAVAQAASMFLG